MNVIGTAGHVDHGKSALVLALTGTDPDRLAEEKARGMTIELGFALLKLPSGREAGIVDVPGHERFVRTMVAGATGFDLVLLVVAANEGLMPQTREHLAIIDLLGIRLGVVALTKSDTAAGEEALDPVRDAVTKALAETTLAGAPIVACSAKTGDGLNDLVRAIDTQLSVARERPDSGRPRLPIDRAFTMPGFGPVVTGTLDGGRLAVGQEVEIAPGGLRARIRGLQNHGRVIDHAGPGQRTAVNLSGIALEELRSGSVLSTPGIMTAAEAIDVRLRAVPYLDRPVRHNLSVTFHTGTAESSGKLLLLDADSVAAGETAWAQVRLIEPIAVLPGDRFIVRGPNGTLGGGTIVSVDPQRHRRHHAPTIANLEALLRPNPFGAMIDVLAAITTAASKLEQVLAAYHARYPTRVGMPRAELCAAIGLPARAFDGLVVALCDTGVLREEGGLVALSDHTLSLSERDERAATAYLAALQAVPYAPPLDGRPSAEVMDYLLGAGKIVRAGDLVFAADAYAEMRASVLERLRAEGEITLGEVRDMFGTSRRYAQALLERMDADGVTKRAGDARILR